jgi:hypothetical protein
MDPPTGPPMKYGTNLYVKNKIPHDTLNLTFKIPMIMKRAMILSSRSIL